MRVLQTSILITVILTIMSCEGGTTFTKIVENNSSETIALKVYINIFSEAQDIEIEPNQSKTIFVFDNERGFADSEYDCASEIDSIRVTTTNGKILTKDILKGDNWTRESKGGRNAKETCTFQIAEEDLN